MKPWLNAQIVLAGILLTLLFPLGADATANLAHSLVKIQPTSPYAGSDSIHLYAARNEYESFQVVLNGPLNGVTVSISPLTGPEGSTLPPSTFHFSRAAYMMITDVSNDEGITGPVPDGLIPERDLFFDEQRNAFPIDVLSGENQLVWVDVFVPENTLPGEYSGVVSVNSTSAPTQNLTLSLTVWDFSLPSTSSLATAFGYEGWGVLFGHFENPDDHYDDIVPLAQRYLESGLMHRLTLSTFLIEDWSLYADPIDWPAFDERWGTFFNGRDLAFGPESARVTSVQIPTIGNTNQEKVNFWQGFAQHFRSNGWFDLLFDYTLDEPSDDPADYQAIRDRADLVHEADPDLRTLVTTDIQEAGPYNMEDYIDIWVPLINFMHGKPYEVCWSTEYEGDQRSDYDDLVAAGKDLWWYQSCMSHGCGDPNDSECYRAWPSYMIDHTAIRNRIMAWMSYRYDIRGELYYDVNYCYDRPVDAWVSQYYFTGNGDGTLFYPGRPDTIGGTTHIPIPTIRLKQIRDGLEDYEYLKLLEQNNGREAVLALMATVVTNTYTYTGVSDDLISVRQQIGEILDGGMIFSDDFEFGDTSAWTSTSP
ncbi:MAG: DUF4091 domain-containing protein [bacterium]|nr:DUF4091 domain-containing protein [bacterium]